MGEGFLLHVWVFGVVFVLAWFYLAVVLVLTSSDWVEPAVIAPFFLFFFPSGLSAAL